MKNRYSLAEMIRRQHATVKFWYNSWKKDRDSTLMAKIRETLKVLKDLVGNASLITDYEDRIMVVKVKKEMEEMEKAVAKTPVYFM